MTTWPPISPRVAKAGLVILEPSAHQVERVITLQYNPDSVNTSMQPRGAGPGGGELTRVIGTANQTITMEAELDATDQLEFPDREQNRPEVENGLHPYLAALEGLLNPPTRSGAGERPPGVRGVPRDRPGTVGHGRARLEPAPHRPGATHRVVDRRGGVRHQAQPDPGQGLAEPPGPRRQRAGRAAASAPSPSASTPAWRRWRKRVDSAACPTSDREWWCDGSRSGSPRARGTPTSRRPRRSPATAGCIVRLRRRFVPQTRRLATIGRAHRGRGRAHRQRLAAEPRRPDPVLAAVRRQPRLPARRARASRTGPARDPPRRESSRGGCPLLSSAARS